MINAIGVIMMFIGKRKMPMLNELMI